MHHTQGLEQGGGAKHRKQSAVGCCLARGSQPVGMSTGDAVDS
mgnify:CR=1 FL=1